MSVFPRLSVCVISNFLNLVWNSWRIIDVEFYFEPIFMKVKGKYNASVECKSVKNSKGHFELVYTSSSMFLSHFQNPFYLKTQKNINSVNK